jgi:hypothetical protein
MQDQHRARAAIVPVRSASDETYFTNLSRDQHALPLYLTIGTNQKDICQTPTEHARIPVGLISCPLNGAKHLDEAWHSAVVTVLSHLRHLHISSPDLKWDWADGFQ